MALHGEKEGKRKKDSAHLLASEWRTRKRRRSRAIVHVGKPSKREEAFTRLGVSHGNPLSWISSKDVSSLSLSLFFDSTSLFSRRGNWLARVSRATRARARAPLAITRESAQGVADTRHLSHSIKAWGESLAALSLFLSLSSPFSLRLWERNSIKTRD